MAYMPSGCGDAYCSQVSHCAHIRLKKKHFWKELHVLQALWNKHISCTIYICFPRNQDQSFDLDLKFCLLKEWSQCELCKKKAEGEDNEEEDLASGQKCKILDSGCILEKGKIVSKPVALLFPGREAVDVKGYIIRAGTKCAVPSPQCSARLLAVPSVKREVRWAPETAQCSSQKGVGPVLAPASIWEWFEENQLRHSLCHSHSVHKKRTLAPEADQVASFTSTEFVFRTFRC